MPHVDAHHHVWQLDRADYAWLTPDLAIYRDYTLDDLRPLLGGIDATILVQAAATEAETAFLLEVAANSDGLVQGVVGWTDLAAPTAAATIERLSQAPLLKGLRPMLQDIPDTSWIIHDSVQPALAAMARCGLRLDLLIQPRHLPLVPSLAARHPTLPLVIDHAAKPGIAHCQWQPWADALAQVARETHALCKLSGLATEAAPDWTPDTLRPYARHILDSFGPARVMWGSDWPVIDLAGGYQRWRKSTLDLLSPPEQDAVLGATARRFYGLHRPQQHTATHRNENPPAT